jgi:hypothetical protein
MNDVGDSWPTPGRGMNAGRREVSDEMHLIQFPRRVPAERSLLARQPLDQAWYSGDSPWRRADGSLLQQEVQHIKAD